jgi:CRISPR-associated protein Csx10
MSVEMLTLKVISPLALHWRRTSEQFAPTLDFIPGSTVRGALAELFLAGDPNKAEETLFQELFLNEAVHFSDFFISPANSSDLPRLLPASAVACKRFPDHYSGSLSDNLLRLELMREWEALALEMHSKWKKCPECEDEGRDGKRDRVGTRYYIPGDATKWLEIRKRMIANTAIERTTGTAAQTMLFSHEVIEESGRFDPQAVYFCGTITVPDRLRNSLHEIAPLQKRLAIGYGRSRGFGQIQVHFWGSPRAATTALRERWMSLNRAVQQLWQKHHREPQGQYFSLTLQSHLALHNEQTGQPILGDIQPHDLGLPVEVERCYCILGSVLVSGWNAALGLPKTDTWALGRGSVLLFRLPPGAALDPVFERLHEIEQNGLGDRRAEGFGRMIVCDPFHYDFLLKEL